MTFHCGVCLAKSSSSFPASGGTPPRQGTQVLFASSLMKNSPTTDFRGTHLPNCTCTGTECIELVPRDLVLLSPEAQKPDGAHRRDKLPTKFKNCEKTLNTAQRNLASRRLR